MVRVTALVAVLVVVGQVLFAGFVGGGAVVAVEGFPYTFFFFSILRRIGKK